MFSQIFVLLAYARSWLSVIMSGATAFQPTMMCTTHPLPPPRSILININIDVPALITVYSFYQPSQSSTWTIQQSLLRSACKTQIPKAPVAPKIAYFLVKVTDWQHRPCQTNVCQRGISYLGRRPLVVLDRLCKVLHKTVTHCFVFENTNPSSVSQVNSCVHSNWSHLLQNLTFHCPSVKAVLPQSPTYAENDNQWRVVLFQWVAKLKPADSRRRLF